MRDQVSRDLMAAVCAPVTVVTTMGVTTAGEVGPQGTRVSTHSRFAGRPRRTIDDTIAACAR